MGMFIFVIGFLTMVVSGIFFVLSLIKKKPLRNKIVIFMGSATDDQRGGGFTGGRNIFLHRAT